jgi:hypothetical protein
MVGARRSGPISLALLPDFFSPRTFFPRAPGQRGENSETQLYQEKGPGPESPILHQLPTGRWVNFLTASHEQTPYSDAHVCTPYYLMKADAFLIHNTRDASTLPDFPLPEPTLLTENASSHTLFYDYA